MYWYRRIWIFIFLIFYSEISGQIKEIGISFGGVSPISDIGNEIFILPSSFSVGGFYKKHLGKRYVFRTDLYYHNLIANDKASIYKVKRDRGYSFNSNLFEISMGMDITFWEYDHFKNENQVLYFIGEISLIRATYKNPQILPNEIIYNDKNLITFGIPLGIGYKKKRGNFVLSLEYKFVITFDNNLDGRSIKNQSNYNVNTHNTYDFYNYITLSFGFTFGRRKCTFCLVESSN